MPTALHLAAPTPCPPARRHPGERRRVPVAGRRVRVAVLDPRGPGALDADDLRRLARVADVTFHRVDAAPNAATLARILRGVDVLAAACECLPVLDAHLLATVPRLPTVVLLHVDDLQSVAERASFPDLAAAG